MNTIAARKDLINEQMLKFEKGRDMAYVAGFYASLIKDLASDKPSDFEHIISILKYNSIPAKYRK